MRRGVPSNAPRERNGLRLVLASESSAAATRLLALVVSGPANIALDAPENEDAGVDMPLFPLFSPPLAPSAPAVN